MEVKNPIEEARRYVANAEMVIVNANAIINHCAALIPTEVYA